MLPDLLRSPVRGGSRLDTVGRRAGQHQRRHELARHLLVERGAGFLEGGAALFLGVCLLIGGSAGNVVGGWLGDRLSRQTKGGGCARW